ncbi:MAG: nickel-dependent hydrogenase large subunit [Candidatus Competibacteraceae bacterium]
MTRGVGIGGAAGSVEGGLRIQVVVEDEIITAVVLTSTRPVNACSILVGRRLAETMTLLPRLFSLCGAAQAVAGLQAAESALDLHVTPAQAAARRMLVVAEALEQTLWRILWDGPSRSGGNPDLAGWKRLRQVLLSLRRLLFPAPIWMRVGGARLVPERAELSAALDEVAAGVHDAVLGRSAGDGPLADRPRFERWLRAAETSAAKTLRFARDLGLADFGCSAVEPLPEFAPTRFEQPLANDADYSFCARPNLAGRVGETGALARCWEHPLIAALRADYGNGLLVRSTARIVECAALVAGLREQARMLDDENPETAVTDTASGSGLGVVECARGRLVHWLAVTEGRVSAYRILAPTEWNFHPEGPLTRGLTGARVGPGTNIRQAIELFVTALDPCVAFEVDGPWRKIG